MKKIKIIGMCGRSGSGKGYVSAAFRRMGIPVVDTDKVYRQLTDGGEEPISECLAELCSRFGEDILNSDGSLNRRALAEIVFSTDPLAKERLAELNKITHKYILAETLRIISTYDSADIKAAVIDAPVLFESGFDLVCHATVCVTCPEELCIQRITERDKISEYDACRRLANQTDTETLRKLCDFEIVNDGRHDIDESVRYILEKLCI